MSPLPRGALIVIEGLDRAGKSTQCEKLCRFLEKEGRRVKHMRFPNRSTPIGKSIDSYLKGETQQEDHVIHLLFSANRWEAAPQIIEHIRDGTTVVIDRYYYSGAVYSAAKNNPNLTLEWAIQPEIGLPKPDLCIFLDISATDAAARGGFGSERYETSEMQKRVRNLFRELLRKPQNKEMVFVNAGESIEEVHEAMHRLVNVLFEGEELHKPLKFFDYD
ncbi:MAG: hypothetical protein L6R38_007795 [Xanthoria sp. 2 TBL-2021]|nr:MAG: hypothetical protein L6R38_007795 [Xanthoria sp. 2 TBL-2021]